MARPLDGPPRGTVTFLFTDIEGSTRLWEEQGEAMASDLARHDVIVRNAIDSRGGYVFKTVGDAFCAAFSTAPAALAAAAAAQDGFAAGEALPWRVRMALHTGAVEARDGDYFGPPLNRVSRILAAAHGGQVLLSTATHELVREALPPGVDLRDLGPHRLRDLTAPERLFQLGSGEFPALRTLHRTNLPVQPSPIIGRETELAEAGELLRQHRLVTLLGPGGSGKTRLALQLAAEATDDFPDGVFWVPLQAIRDPALVERATAAAVGSEEELSVNLADRRVLILLDNFEQVVEAARVVARLIAATRNASFLVTSREPLQLAAERRYPVEPLLDSDAVRLFIERAHAIDPGFRSTIAVEQICRRLDRLPLAIELAAARIALLDPDALLTRLDRRLPLLATRSRDSPERQQTLHGTIEWSYDLLGEDDRRLLRGLSVFADSFTLEAAETVCGAALDAVESLVIKSLLRRRGSGRFGMLETIREYAADRLAESGESEELHRRHAEYYAGIAESMNLSAEADAEQHHELGIGEQHNVRAALRWAMDADAVELGLRLAIAYETFWIIHDPAEGIRWFSALIDRAGSTPLELRGRALRAYGGAHDISGNFEIAERLWQESLAVFEELGDERGRAILLHRLAISAQRRGDLARASDLVDQSHAIHVRTGSDGGRRRRSGPWERSPGTPGTRRALWR